jgi:hypothetical protein
MRINFRLEYLLKVMKQTMIKSYFFYGKREQCLLAPKGSVVVYRPTVLNLVL